MKHKKDKAECNLHWIVILVSIAYVWLFVPEASYGQKSPQSGAGGLAVSGVIVDKQQNPLAGVSVMEKSTTNGVITDVDGHFSLQVSSPEAGLVISYVGFKKLEMKVDHKRKLTLVMEEDAAALDEIVVIGYGTQRKGDITSAVSSVKAENFTVGKIGDAAELVKGKIAGLSITKTSGDPNASSSIMLRGITTVLGDVSPLVLIDGVEGSLKTVAPENIASFDVLKDASAAAIYGTRGANGVILITTKSGKRDSNSSITYSSYASLSNWYKTAKFMDTNDVIYGRTSFTYGGYDTNWLKAVTRKAGYMQNHSLTLMGGSKNNNYSGNVTYSDEYGIMRKSDARDLKVQLDLTQYAMKDILKFNFNVLYTKHKNTNNNNAYVYRQALIHNPSSPVYEDDGSYFENFNLYQYYNPREIQDELIGDTRSSYARLTGNVTLEPIKGWKTNVMLSSGQSNSTGENYYTNKYYSMVTSSISGWASKSSDNGRSDNIEATSTYDYVKGKSSATALVGYSYLYNVYDGFAAGNGNFTSQSYLYNNLGQGSYLTDSDNHASMSSYKNDNTLAGFFGRVSYGYDNRYNLMLSIRREGSSKFGDNHKWGNFPSASVGWTLSSEQFMKKYTWLNNLRFRLGYGVTGVIPTDSYASLTLFNYDTYGYHLGEDGSWYPSLKVAQNPNPDLKWEKTKELNFGFDWSVLKNRISGSIDLYHKKTVDLLYQYSVPVPPNMYSYTTANVGDMLNKGIEVMVNAIVLQNKNFEWNTTLTLSHNSNKLLSLSNDLYQTDNFAEVGGLGDPISVTTHAMEVGHRLGDFWGLKSVGVDENGFVLVQVSDGNGGWTAKEFNSSYNEQANRQRLGNGLPQLYAGWNHSFHYKNFDLNLQFTGQFGYKILNAQRAFYENNSIAYNRLKSAAKWYGAVDTDGNAVIDASTGKQKQVQLSSSMGQGFWSDHLENGDFVKLTSASIGYSLPLSSSLKDYIKSAKVYVSGQNLFCITGYSGLDPEVSNYFLYPGIDDRDKYPTTRSFTLGLNINF